MGWTITSYADTQGNGPSGAWIVGLFEMCRAVNERQAATGRGKTLFAKADGTFGSDLSLSDLVGQWTASGSNYVRTNLLGINSFISGNYKGYTTTVSSETAWTIAGLTAETGYTSDAPTRIQDATYWQMLQDTLDLLIYAWGHLQEDQFQTTHSLSYSSDSYATIATAWANRTDNNTSGGSGGPRMLAQPAGGGNWIARYRATTIRGYTEDYFHLSDVAGSAIYSGLGTISGSITSAYYVYSVKALELAASVAFTINGSANSISASENLREQALSISLSGSIFVTIALTIPSSSPFNEESSPAGDSDLREAYITGLTLQPAWSDEIRIYVDITSELTDQA